MKNSSRISIITRIVNKMINVISTLFFLFITCSALAQKYTIKVKFKSSPKKIYITGLYVDQFKMIDSVDVINNVAEIKISKKDMPVNYQLLGRTPTSTKAYKTDKSFFFYFENENIEIESPDSLVNNVTAKIIKGQRLMDYNRVEHIVKNYELTLRKKMRDIYYNTEEYDNEKLAGVNQALNEQYNTANEERQSILDRNSVEFQQVTHLLSPLKITLTNNDELNRLALLKAYETTYHFNKQVMMFTPLLKERITSYLALHRSRVLTYEENQKEMMHAVDHLLKVTSENKNVRFAVMKALLLYIRKYSYDEALLHIDQQYVSKVKDEMDVKFMDYLLEPYRKCAPGEKAENFIAKDINGAEVDLYKIKSKYIGLLFFSSACSHCIKEFPMIKEWYNSIDHAAIKIITIALDRKKKSWEKFLNEGQYPFQHICDFKSWNSPIVNKFNVHATPTLIILDKDKVILKKFVQTEDVKSFFSDKL